MNVLTWLSPRTLTSAARTAVYGAIAALFMLGDAAAHKLVDAAVIGGVAADYFTWLIRSVAGLPRNILHGCFEACLNLGFGLYFYRFVQTDFGSDPERLAIGFLAFLFVAGVKTTAYGLELVAAIGDDEED